MNWLSWLVPWQPSPTVAVTTLVVAALYIRGCRARREPILRQVGFWLGLVLIYGALHTRLDYYAQREFFIHQIQETVLHHLGPFLIALAWPGATLLAGVPAAWRERWLAPLLASRPVRASLNLLLHPVVNGALFVGLTWFWLLPPVDFYAGLDIRIYRAMNWSMTLSGLLFWCLALDPRASPPARIKPGARILLIAAVMPPQVASGALISLAGQNLYPIYDLCGRAFATISSHNDQVLGGLILWIPSVMMHIAGALVAMYFWYRLTEHPDPDDRPRPPAGRRDVATPTTV